MRESPWCTLRYRNAPRYKGCDVYLAGWDSNFQPTITGELGKSLRFASRDALAAEMVRNPKLKTCDDARLVADIVKVGVVTKYEIEE